MDTTSEPIAVIRVNTPEAGKVAALYQQHATGALRLAFLITGDRANAEDLVQDAFEKVIKRLQHVRHPDNFGAYLKRSVVNLAISKGRRSALEERHEETQRDASPLSTPFPNVEDRYLLSQALLALPYQQRLIVVLRIYEDLSEKEVGRMLKLSPAAVRSSLHRATTSLRRHMQEVEIDG